MTNTVLVAFIILSSLIIYGVWKKFVPKVVQEEHYGEMVRVSCLGESLRKENCLCLLCAYMKNCPFAKEFYENCKRGNIALMVTRCREWQPKEK